MLYVKTFATQRVHILCHHGVKRVNETKILGYQSHLCSMNQFTIN